MYEINVNLDKSSYNIYIEKNLTSKLNFLIKDLLKGQTIVLISDSNVAPLYGEKVIAQLKSLATIHTIVIPAGEESKSMEVLCDIYDKLAEYQVTSKDLIIGLGGGVVGDLTGYASATFKRGIPFVNIPTTLLAQVDSSVGGKTGINHKAGKNLIGAFNQPEAVFIDTLMLNTLSDDIFKDGLCEAIKYGCIFDRELFEMLLSSSLSDLRDDMDEIIAKCCSLKAETVAADEFDTGERMKLNFGHTIGHGIEKLLNYSGISHGLAVGIGMYQITKNAEKLGLTPVNTSDMIKELLVNFNLPYEFPDINKQNLVDAMSNDKKSRSNNINLILLKKIGKSYIYEAPKEELIEFVKE